MPIQFVLLRAVAKHLHRLLIVHKIKNAHVRNHDQVSSFSPQISLLCLRPLQTPKDII